MKKVYLLICICLLIPGQTMAFCFEEAGKVYGISPLLLQAISEVESGSNPNAINRNPDGSYDFGLMQINSSWAKTLGKNNWLRLGDPCLNVMVGAWVLAQCMERYGYNWEAVGCYNASSRSKRMVYAHKVYKKMKELGWR